MVMEALAPMWALQTLKSSTLQKLLLEDAGNKNFRNVDLLSGSQGILHQAGAEAIGVPSPGKGTILALLH